MTTTEHDLRCPEIASPGRSADPERCTCRDAQGHARPESWADGAMLAYDLETTGPDPDTALIVTATIVEIRPGQSPIVTNWLADPGVEIPEGAVAVHGITTEHAREHGQPAADVVVEIGEAISRGWAAGIPLVAYNASYDVTVLHRELIRHCDDRGIHLLTDGGELGPVIDPLVLDRGVDRYRRGKRTLTAACEHYRVVLENAHSSDADALAAARVAWKIAKAYPEVGTLPLDELQTWQRAAHLVWAEHFGQYLTKQGKPDDVERDWPLRGAS